MRIESYDDSVISVAGRLPTRPQYLSLAHLPPPTTGPLLSFTRVPMALLGILFLGERPAALQWAGTGQYLAGVTIYFYPVTLSSGEGIGFGSPGPAEGQRPLLDPGTGREPPGRAGPESATVVSMGLGAVTLLTSDVPFRGCPAWHWGIGLSYSG